MVENAADRLTSLFQGLQHRLEGDLGADRAAIGHPVGRGDATEEDWLRMLKAHLPSRYQCDRATVVDSRGDASDQIDIVVYDRQYSPLLFNHSGQIFVPAEGVYAALEVKQILTREHIQYAGDKAASVRRLHRTSTRIPYAGGSHEPRVLPDIIGGLLTHQSGWSPALGEPLSDALRELDELHRLDLGCSLTDGTFEVTYPATAPCETVFAADGLALVQFLFRLLRRLQAMATVPAIDYSAYLDKLAGAAVAKPG